MKSLSVEDLKSLLADARNSETKKTWYLVAGIIVAVLVIVAMALFVKKYTDAEDYYDEWDDEDWDDFDDEAEEKEPLAEDAEE
ncbi:MAG TPA: hypothetical protein H9687_05500 [Firmicutes bacterium]|nr:hypothetical protein [Bacillota bacterium]